MKAVYLLILMLCCGISGCVTLGPKVATEFVLVHPGKPCRVLKNIRVPAQHMADGKVGQVEIGGWVCMPPSHWDVIEAKLKGE